MAEKEVVWAKDDEFIIWYKKMPEGTKKKVAFGKKVLHMS